MSYEAFYYCERTGDDVSGEDAIPLDRDTIVSTAMQVLRDPRDFFGIVDSAGTTLQFIVEDDGGVWVEVPIPSKRGSYGKHIAIDDVEPILLSVQGPLGVDTLDGLVFSAW